MYINLLVPDFLIPAANAKCIRGKHLGSRVWNCPDAGNEAKILEWAQQGPMQRWLQVPDDQRALPSALGRESLQRIHRVSFAVPLCRGILLLMPRAEP